MHRPSGWLPAFTFSAWCLGGGTSHALTVTDEDGIRVPGVEIVVTRAGVVAGTGTTDDDGVARVHGAHGFELDVTLIKAGFQRLVVQGVRASTLARMQIALPLATDGKCHAISAEAVGKREASVAPDTACATPAAPTAAPAPKRQPTRTVTTEIPLEDFMADVAQGLPAACDSNSVFECRMLAEMLRDGGAGMPTDLARARKYMERACALSDQDACQLLQYADLRAPDRPRPPRSLGVAGRGARRTALASACDTGDGAGCALLAFDLFSEKGPAAGSSWEPLARRGLELDDPLAMWFAGVMATSGNWDRDDGAALLDRARGEGQRVCAARNDATACSAAGTAILRITGIPMDPAACSTGPAAEGLNLLRRGCELGDGFGCWQLGQVVYYQTVTHPGAKKEMLDWYRLSCEAGYPRGCRDRYSWGAETDPASLDYRDRACGLGELDACAP